jgi:glycerophosphoryl diester phosphodiesterase
MTRLYTHRFEHSMISMLYSFFLRFAVTAVLAVVTLSHCDAQMITAHRGASYDAPENTLAAFQLAWEQGADAIEGDFYLTADNEIVCIHDKDTERTASVKRLVEASNVAELRSLDVGTWKDAKFKAERIPLFTEVFASVPSGKRFVIELKSKEKIVPVLMKQLAELNAKPEHLLIISFDAKSIAKCKALRPDIRAHWLTGFKANSRGNMAPSASEIAATVQKCKADGVGMQGDVNVIDEAFITELRDKGCREFHVWTIDDPQHAARFQSLGTIGITTNRPAFIREAISANKP